MKILSAGVLLVFLVSCNPANSPQPVPTVPQTLTVGTGDWESGDGRNWAFGPETNLASSRQVTLDLSFLGTGEIYYLLTNTSSNLFGGSAGISGFHPLVGTASERSLAASAPAPSPRIELSSLGAVAPPDRPRPGARGLSALVSPDPETYVVGDQFDFIDAFWGSTPGASNHHATTLRKVVAADGRTVNIWVSDKAWKNSSGPGAPDAAASSSVPLHGVTQEMVDAFAVKFLNPDESGDDIYHWVSDIFGAEWPAAGNPPNTPRWINDGYLIKSGGVLDIFVVNLNPGPEKSSRMMGYFHNLNNFVKQTTGYTRFSNARILFALDASSLGDPDDDGDKTTTGDAGTWALTDYWPDETLSTLAHEFQHMIQYYQKQVLLDADDTDPWINEMASLVTEDMVSDKLHTFGPRGLKDDYTTGAASNGRGWFPWYKYAHLGTSLTGWGVNQSGEITDNYAISYAFGAWLLRNYGGPELFRGIVQSSYSSKDAIVKAVYGSDAAVLPSYRKLVRNWGLSTFLESSTLDDLRLRSTAALGTADAQFDWTIASAVDSASREYAVGSIDLGRYNQPLVIHTASNPPPALLYAGATLFFKETGTYTGSFTRTLTLPPNVVLTVVEVPEF